MTKKQLVPGGFIVESLEGFVQRFSEEIGCYYHKTKNSRYYTIKKYDSMYHGAMGHFGWIDELIRKRLFRIESYKDLADKAKVTHLSDEIKKDRHYQKGVDAVISYVKKGSHGDDYKKAVTALKAIMDLKN